MEKPFLNLLCLRHGKTKYTGVFPDLTPEGIDEVSRVAQTTVSVWLRENTVDPKKLLILSSPQARSRGTATIIADDIQYPYAISTHQQLDAMQWRNPESCKRVLGDLAGRGYIDYETEPIFRNHLFFETPEEICERWYNFFTGMIAEATKKEPQYMILFSHYEVFCPIVLHLFDIVASEATALKHVEPISLSVTSHGRHHVRVIGEFRGMIRTKLFNCNSLTFDDPV